MPCIKLSGPIPLVQPQLGGKDPAYVRPDADLEYTVAELVDGTLCTFAVFHVQGFPIP